MKRIGKMKQARVAVKQRTKIQKSPIKYKKMNGNNKVMVNK